LNINKELWQDTLFLQFADRQKNKMNFLHISLHKNETLVAETVSDKPGVMDSSVITCSACGE